MSNKLTINEFINHLKAERLLAKELDKGTGETDWQEFIEDYNPSDLVLDANNPELVDYLEEFNNIIAEGGISEIDTYDTGSPIHLENAIRGNTKLEATAIDLGFIFLSS